MKKIITLCSIFFMIFNFKAFANENMENQDNSYQKQSSMIDTKSIENYINSISNETEGYLPEFNFKSFINNFKGSSSSFNVNDILMGFLRFFLKDVLLNTRLLGKLIILAIICAVLHNLESAFKNDSISNIAYYACYLILVIIVVKSFSLAIEIGRDTINRMVDFMAALLPTLLTLLVSVGGLTSASIFDPLVMGAVQVVSNIIRNFIFPIIYLTAVLSIVNNLSDTFKVSKLSGMLRQVCIWTQGILLTTFIGIITVRGATSQTIDQVAAKTAKYAVDNFIPIVGKALSDAVATIAGYSLILKDAISTAGMIAIIFTCAFPLIKIISLIFIYKMVSALIEPISDKRIVTCLNDVGNALVLIFSSVLCVAVMFFIMITIIASTGRTAILM